MSSRYNSSSTSREQSSSSSSADGRIYVGNLPPDVREKDIEDLFFKYGRISNIDLKSRSPGPSFAFIEFEDRRDAEDAIYYRNGYNYDSCRLRVERPRGGGPRGAYSGHGGGGGGGGGSSSSSSWGRRGGAPPRRSDYRCTISDLPSTGSWQDLKDHMRAAGDVCYADVYRDCTGVVEYVNEDDMRYAVKNLDDTKFRSHEGDTTRIIVKADFGGGRSRSRSPVRRYSPKRRSHSPKRSRRSYSKSSSRSRSKSKARDSRSRSRSRSR